MPTGDPELSTRTEVRTTDTTSLNERHELDWDATGYSSLGERQGGSQWGRRTGLLRGRSRLDLDTDNRESHGMQHTRTLRMTQHKTRTNTLSGQDLTQRRHDASRVGAANRRHRTRHAETNGTAWIPGTTQHQSKEWRAARGYASTCLQERLAGTSRTHLSVRFVGSRSGRARPTRTQHQRNAY